MRLRQGVLTILGLLWTSGTAAGRSGPINVLVMHWYDRGYYANDIFDSALRAALQATASESIEYYSEYLETNRFSGDDQAQLLSEYLRKKYVGKRLDVIITGVSPTLDFLLKYRHELFPNVPLVFATERPVPQAVLSQAGATGFIFANTNAKTLKLALEWHPGTKQLFVVSGTLNHDKALESILRDELRPYENTISITYLTDFAPDELTARIRTLPEDSLILYVWQQVLDPQGRLLETGEVLARVTQEARVPVYGRSHAMIGRGVVGGYVWTQEGVAAKLADLTMQVLNGAAPKDIPIEKGPDTPMFDWRQLQRWGIDEDRLPPDSIIRFRDLTIWQRYKWRIIGTITVVVLQAVLIGALLIQRRRTRAAQQVLQESEERFRNMADTAPTMIWVSGPDQQFTFLNRAWLTFTGRRMEQDLGQGWMECVHPDDRDRVVGAYSSVFETLDPFQVEYRRRRADGEYRDLLCTGVPRFQKDTAFAGYIGSCVDITAVKRAREGAIARQKLESMGLLASGIAHDFNNLLGGILASTDLALASLVEDSDAYRELLRTRTAAIRGAGIVRQLMIYGGNESPAFESVDLAMLVGEMVQLLRVSISKHAILKTEFVEGLPPVQANPAQIRQVVMNLVINASEAIGEREGQIRVATTLVTLGRDSLSTQSGDLAVGEYLQLEVSDSGRGMTEEARVRIFDPFYTTKATGRGLGLAVAHGIVRGHGGAISIASSPGQGSTFRVLFPCKGRRGNAPQRALPAVGTKATSAEGTILFVEDEDLLREAVAAMLRRTGFTVIEAGDGTSALDLFRANASNIDVVLLDMTLPGRSGREVLTELQLMQPNVRVVITSAYGSDSIMKSLDGIRSGPFIRKPYQVSQLITLLRSLAAQAGMSSQVVG